MKRCLNCGMANAGKVYCNGKCFRSRMMFCQGLKRYARLRATEFVVTVQFLGGLPFPLLGERTEKNARAVYQ